MIGQAVGVMRASNVTSLALAAAAGGLLLCIARISCSLSLFCIFPPRLNGYPGFTGLTGFTGVNLAIRLASVSLAAFDKRKKRKKNMRLHYSAAGNGGKEELHTASESPTPLSLPPADIQARQDELYLSSFACGIPLGPSDRRPRGTWTRP